MIKKLVVNKKGGLIENEMVEKILVIKCRGRKTLDDIFVTLALT